MKDALDKIVKIIYKQVEELEAKSAKARLDEKEIDSLGSLARTYILVTGMTKKPKTPKYTKGKFMTDEQLESRAVDPDEQK